MQTSEYLRSATHSDRLLPPKTVRQWVRDLFPNLRDAAIRWGEDDAGSMAASVAYYLALSLFPMVLLLISGLGLFLKFTKIGNDAQTQLLEIIAQQGSPVFEDTFRSVIEQLENHSVVSGPTGLLAAVLAAIGVFAQLDRGFDRVWRIPVVRHPSLHATVYNVVRHRFSAFLMLLSLGAMIAALFVASMVFSHVSMVSEQWLPWLNHASHLIDLSFTIVVNGILFSMIYKFLPKTLVRWPDAFRGGILTAGIWEIGRSFLGAFLIGMRYTSAYGAIGSFIALLLWCYYGMSIIFFGAEYVQVLQRRREDKIREERLQTAAPSISAVALAETTSEPLDFDPEFLRPLLKDAPATSPRQRPRLIRRAA